MASGAPVSHPIHSSKPLLEASTTTGRRSHMRLEVYELEDVYRTGCFTFMYYIPYFSIYKSVFTVVLCLSLGACRCFSSLKGSPQGYGILRAWRDSKINGRVSKQIRMHLEEELKSIFDQRIRLKRELQRSKRLRTVMRTSALNGRVSALKEMAAIPSHWLKSSFFNASSFEVRSVSLSPMRCRARRAASFSTPPTSTATATTTSRPASCGSATATRRRERLGAHAAAVKRYAFPQISALSASLEKAAKLTRHPFGLAARDEPLGVEFRLVAYIRSCRSRC